MKHLLISLLLFILSAGNCFGGECIGGEESWLTDVKDGIEQSLRNPNDNYHDIGPWWYCWAPSGDEKDRLDAELWSTIRAALQNEHLQESIKIDLLEMARIAAIENTFDEIVALYSIDDNFKTNYANIIWSIWKRHSKDNKEIFRYNIAKILTDNKIDIFEDRYKFDDWMWPLLDKYGENEFFKTYLPQFYVNNNQELDYFVGALAYSKYRHNYPKAKKLLMDTGLFDFVNPGSLGIFPDPRALEDSISRSPNAKIHPDTMFFALANHLELEFKPEWLRFLLKHQFSLLRNGIYATYGYDFKSKSKRISWIKNNINSFSRNDVRGKSSGVFNNSLITEVDKKNIELIRSFEKK